MTGLQIIDWATASKAARHAALGRPAQGAQGSLTAQVRDIIELVRRDGDDALRALTSRLDKASLESLKVDQDELADAGQRLSERQLSAIDLAIRNVRLFHEAQLPPPVSVETMTGVRCERLSHPLGAVGLYVPAGTAPLPSTAVMLAVPAAIAGCPNKIICTPPRPDGRADPAVLVAAARSGVQDIFKIGGAQAVAAMAFGTETVPKVDKIFGPGNAWVTEAKAQVAATPDGAAIDMPAGPSELLVIADEKANAEFIASDLLSQAEHGEDSQVVLVTISHALATQVISEVKQQLETLNRRKIAACSIANSRVIVTASLAQAIEVSNAYAPEHLILHVEAPRNLLQDVRNAGSVFLGCWSPESVGDYCSGTNHVLPTYGYARSYSGLSVDQFLRQMTVQELTADGLRCIAEPVMELATLEGLDAHAAAVARRVRFLEHGQ